MKKKKKKKKKKKNTRKEGMKEGEDGDGDGGGDGGGGGGRERTSSVTTLLTHSLLPHAAHCNRRKTRGTLTDTRIDSWDHALCPSAAPP